MANPDPTVRKPATIFLSNKRNAEPDEPLALRMREEFQKRALDVFIDQHNIPVGSRWGEVIARAATNPRRDREAALTATSLIPRANTANSQSSARTHAATFAEFARTPTRAVTVREPRHNPPHLAANSKSSARTYREATPSPALPSVAVPPAAASCGHPATHNKAPDPRAARTHPPATPHASR